MTTVTLFHNPRCSKSRQTLSLLEEQGITPEVVLYLETAPTVDELLQLLNKLKLPVRDIIRSGEQEYKDLNLSDDSLNDEQLLSAVQQHPRLLQRPIVVKGDKAAIGRPPESVLDIL